jgi:activating signal cointegrator 1
VRAISLHQPWATLVARRLKQFETRHWATTYRGPLAIHAARRWDLSQREAARLWRLTESELPFGSVIAVCVLADCYPTSRVPAAERVYGDFAAGRFAWRLEAAVSIEPIPFKGLQQFFDVPDQLLLGKLAIASP